MHTSRPRISGRRLTLNEEDQITRADNDFSMGNDRHRELPLAASPLLRSVQQPLQPLREIVPSALTQSQPAAPASVPGSVGQISSALTVQTPQSVQQVHYSAAGAAAVTTESASAQPKVTAKPTADQLIIQTRRQKQDAADKALQENNALTSLLKEALENGKTKNDFKMGDKIPEFLITYSSTLVSRANSHPPPDELAENLFPYLYRVPPSDVYNLNHSEITHDILNILNTLYEFEHSTPSTPSKVSNWIKQKYSTLNPKQRAKSAAN